MRLVTKIKLLSSLQQKSSLKETLERCSDVCNFVSSIVYSSGNSSFIDLQKLLYYDIKEDFSLSAQMTLLCLNKTANDYHSPHFCERHYKKNSAIPFDDRVLTFFTHKKEISIWTINGRMKIPFAHGEKQRSLLEKRVGQSDLVFENNEFFLLVGYEEKEKSLDSPQDFLGVDLGIKKLAVDS
jgi:predicted transposase